MKSIVLFMAMCFYLPTSSAALNAAPAVINTDSILLFLENTKSELLGIKNNYEQQLTSFGDEIERAEIVMAGRVAENQMDWIYVEAMVSKINAMESRFMLEQEMQFALTKVRYRKGLDLIKMIYEKVLALDHHFAALQTYQNIAVISNPNSYPDFQAAKTLLEKKGAKANPPLQLPALLQSNPYVTVAGTLISLFTMPIDNKEKEAELNKISCILDFTVRMSADLNTICHETGFLRDMNNTLKDESLRLFDDYVQVLSYNTPLDRCRKADDWDKILEMLDKYVEDMEVAMKKMPSDKGVYKKQVNLEFAVDRLLDYINKYSTFVAQGEKYYQKFKSIVDNYENKVSCADKLPRQFEDLKKDIDISIEKFNNSYNLTELKGSKLKDLLYGNAGD